MGKGKGSMSRRTFVSAGMAASAAIAAGAAVVPAVGDEGGVAWDMQADVVIIGAGGAGMSAACTAVEAGASVLVLEKGAVTGGDTALSGQTSIGPWPEFEAELGVEDSIELYMEEQADSYKWGPFAEQGREFPAEHPYSQLQAELHAEMMEWTRDTVGVGWSLGSAPGDPNTEGVLPQPTWNSVNTRSFMAMDPSASIMVAFNAYAEKIGVDVRLRTMADEIIMQDGRAVGVIAYDESGKRLAVKAAKAVIVATGAFTGNPSMMERFVPQAAGINGGGCYGATGDGIGMIRAIGGSISELDLGAHWYPFEAGTNSGQFSTTLIFYGGTKDLVPISEQPGVVLNYDGKRFVSESNGYSLIGRATAGQVCHEAWYVFDSHPMVADMILGIIPYINRVVQADTLEELFKITRLPSDVAQQEIDAYNEGIAAGEDAAFGKLLIGCQPIDQGPFYAINIRPRPYATYGGVDADLDARVLDLDGNPIPGLYAAGIVTGSYACREGYFYNGGLAQALIFGRLAGKNAAAEEAWEPAAPTGLEAAPQDLGYVVSCTSCHGDTRAAGMPNYHGF